MKKLGIFLSLIMILNGIIFVYSPVTYADSDSISYKLIEPNAKIFPDIVTNDFETRIEGWQVGSNASAVQQVSTILNDPQEAFSGTYMFEMGINSLSGHFLENDFQTVYRTS